MGSDAPYMALKLPVNACVPHGCMLYYLAVILKHVRKDRMGMKHVKTLKTKKLQNTVKKGGCGECQTSCQSACKTSCTVGNQSCERK